MSAHKMPHAGVSWSPEQLSPLPLCVWLTVCENVFTVRVINGCKRSFSPRFCAKPRTSKEKGQKMKGSFMAINDFLEKHMEVLSVCVHFGELKGVFVRGARLSSKQKVHPCCWLMSPSTAVCSALYALEKRSETLPLLSLSFSLDYRSS